MNTDLLDADLRRDEGERMKPYDDATGKELAPGDTLKGSITISIGVDLSIGLDEDESLFLYQNRRNKVVGEVMRALPWAVNLNDARQRVLCNIAYNAGINGLLEFHRMLADCQAGDWNSAAREIETSHLAPARRERLAEMMKSGT